MVCKILLRLCNKDKNVWIYKISSWSYKRYIWIKCRGICKWYYCWKKDNFLYLYPSDEIPEHHYWLITTIKDKIQKIYGNRIFLLLNFVDDKLEVIIGYTTYSELHYISRAKYSLENKKWIKKDLNKKINILKNQFQVKDQILIFSKEDKKLLDFDKIFKFDFKNLELDVLLKKTKYKSNPKKLLIGLLFIFVIVFGIHKYINDEVITLKKEVDEENQKKYTSLKINNKKIKQTITEIEQKIEKDKQELIFVKNYLNKIYTKNNKIKGFDESKITEEDKKNKIFIKFDYIPQQNQKTFFTNENIELNVPEQYNY